MDSNAIKSRRGGIPAIIEGRTTRVSANLLIGSNQSISGSFTMGAGGLCEFEVNNAFATPGDGADFIDISGTLEITADVTPNTRFTIALVSLNDAAERPHGFPVGEAFVRSQSNWRLEFGYALKQAISRYGGSRDEGSSIAAKAPRSGFRQRTLSPEDDGEAVIEECIRGEQGASADYVRKL